MSARIGIIDYGMGNLGSVTNACRYLNLSAGIITKPDEIDQYTALILPGVGAFGDCVSHLVDHGLQEPLRQWIQADRPFLGICLGLQVLFEGSEESPDAKGLGIFPGVVRRFRLPPEYKVPQIGWSRVQQQKSECPLFRDIADSMHFYFVHSYYADSASADFTAGITTYGVDYTSALWQGKTMAVQFHPEKSQRLGLQMLSNFAVWVKEEMER